jgi:fucose permease
MFKIHWRNMFKMWAAQGIMSLALEYLLGMKDVSERMWGILLIGFVVSWYYPIITTKGDENVRK